MSKKPKRRRDAFYASGMFQLDPTRLIEFSGGRGNIYKKFPKKMLKKEPLGPEKAGDGSST